MARRLRGILGLALALASLAAPGWCLDPGLDLLQALSLHNTSRQGVSTAPGPLQLRPAYHLQGDYRDLRLPASWFQRAVQLLRHSPEFTLSAALRQEESNSGTIISFSSDILRYLELQSSGRKDEIRLHYTSAVDSQVHVEVFPYRLADNAWHKLALSVSGSQVELLVDCHTVYRRIIRPGPPDRNFTKPQLQLWVGQRNNKHSLFKGSLQDVRLIPGPHGYLSQCPHIDTTCPTCGQFSLLQSTVQELTKSLQELSQRLVAAEGRLEHLEDCDCIKSCNVNGTIKADGASWQKDCDLCACVHGEVQCRPVRCGNIPCKNPIFPKGECCPTCLKQCFIKGQLYDHGDQVSWKECLECECQDGNFLCRRINQSEHCPKLHCRPEEQLTVPGNCCKFCPGVDYCAKGHTCHVNSTCLNLIAKYTCSCNEGFEGDGESCTDVDECKHKGDVGGHHCHLNTRCVNTVGGYECECLDGYRRVDKFNCAENDECSSGEHACHEHARCINTQGSYHCVCHDGYQGDGYHCQPVCNQTCLNGGECSAPGHCSCQNGYMGPACESDLDECITGQHRCQDTAVCVNMPGWYYCKCKQGYHSIIKENYLGTTCKDIDECSQGTHTCHPSSRCINTDGHFKCICTVDEGPHCKLSCMFEGKEVNDGAVVSPMGQPCKRCTCEKGVISCREPTCDCSTRVSEQCCPQCNPSASCRHQELKEVIFKSGERWIYQCQTCECLYGEIDCWPMECPPQTCTDPILSSGDCCPRCPNDPCSLSPSGNTTAPTSATAEPCLYAGQLHISGSEWRDPADRCTACSCKDGQLCCSYDFRCPGGGPVGWDGVAAAAGTDAVTDGGAVRIAGATPEATVQPATSASTAAVPLGRASLDRLSDKDSKTVKPSGESAVAG